MSDWRITKLRDLCTLITKGTTPSTLGHPFTTSGSNFVKAEAVTPDGFIDCSTFTFVDKATHETVLKRARLEEGDVLFSMAGVSIGKTAVVPSSILPANTNQAGGIIRCDRMKADPRFIHYYLKNPRFNEYLNSLVAQSAQPNLNLTEIGDLPIRHPNLAEQGRIADILSTLDERIATNRRTNHTLEEMSQALFKSWFVDFDPVVAKSEGRKPFGMSDDIAALFPDSFEESELGAVPKGWRVESLASEFLITMGQSPPGTSYNEHGEGTLFFQGRGEFGQRYPTPRLFTKAPTRLAKAYDTLVTVRAPVGDINQCLNDCCIGRGLAAIRHNQDSKAYTFYRFRNLTAEFESFNGDGTLFGSLTGDGLRGIKHVVPPKSVRVAFEAIAGTIDDKVRLNHIESETLTKMRDSLLPQLISGEVNLKSANQLCAEATAA